MVVQLAFISMYICIFVWVQFTAVGIIIIIVKTNLLIKMQCYHMDKMEGSSEVGVSKDVHF